MWRGPTLQDPGVWTRGIYTIRATCVDPELLRRWVGVSYFWCMQCHQLVEPHGHAVEVEAHLYFRRYIHLQFLSIPNPIYYDVSKWDVRYYPSLIRDDTEVTNAHGGILIRCYRPLQETTGGFTRCTSTLMCILFYLWHTLHLHPWFMESPHWPGYL